MGSITRDLYPYSVARVSQYLVQLVYLEKTALGDGSFETSERNELVRAFMVNLTDALIERLQSGGITTQDSSILGLSYELFELPDSIIFQSQRYKNVKFLISEGVTFFGLTKTQIGVAQLDPRAT